MTIKPSIEGCFLAEVVPGGESALQQVIAEIDKQILEHDFSISSQLRLLHFRIPAYQPWMYTQVQEHYQAFGWEVRRDCDYHASILVMIAEAEIANHQRTLELENNEKRKMRHGVLLYLGILVFIILSIWQFA